MKKFINTFLIFLSSLVFAYSSLFADSQNESGIKWISPSGNNAKQTNEITIKFDNNARQIIGEKIEDQIKITINNETMCSPYWKSNSEMSCKMQKQISKATKYQVRIYPKSNRNKEIEKYNFIHEFSTSPPRLIYCDIQSWKNITEPSIMIEFDQPVTQQSIENNVYIKSINSEKKYKIKATLKEKKLSKHKYINSNNFWIISPVKAIEENQEVEIIVDKGIESIFGNQTSNKKYSAKRFSTYGKIKLLDAYCISSDKKVHSILNNNSKKQTLCSTSSYITLNFSNPIKINQDLQKKIIISPNLKNDIKLLMQQSESLKNTPGAKYEVILKLDLEPNKEYKIHVAKNNSSIYKKIKNFVFNLIDKNNKDLNFIIDEFGQHFTNYTQLKFKTEDLEKDLLADNIIKVINEKEINSSNYKLLSTNLRKLIFKYNYINEKNRFMDNTLEADVSGKINKKIEYKPNLSKIFDSGQGVIYGKILTVPTLESKKEDSTIFMEYTNIEINATLDKNSMIVFLKDSLTGAPLQNADVKIVSWDIEKFNQWEVIKSLQTNEFGISNFDGNFYQKATDNWKEGKAIYIVANKKTEMAILPINKNFFHGGQLIANKNSDHYIVTENFSYTKNDSIYFSVCSPCPNLQYKVRLINLDNEVIYEKKIKNSNLYKRIRRKLDLNKDIKNGQYKFVLYNQENNILDATALYIQNKNENLQNSEIKIIEHAKNVKLKIENKSNNKKIFAHVFLKAVEVKKNVDKNLIFGIHSNKENNREYENQILGALNEITKEKILINKDIEISNSEEIIEIKKSEIPFDNCKLIADVSIEESEFKFSKSYSEKEIVNDKNKKIEINLNSIVAEKEGDAIEITSQIIKKTAKNQEDEKNELNLAIDILDMRSASWVRQMEIAHHQTEDSLVFKNYFKPKNKGIYRATIKQSDSNKENTKFFISLVGKNSFLSNKKRSDPIIVSIDKNDYIKYLILSPSKRISGNITIKQGDKIQNLPIIQSNESNIVQTDISKNDLNHGIATVFVNLYNEKTKKFQEIYFLEHVNKDLNKNKIIRRFENKKLLIDIHPQKGETLLTAIAFDNAEVNKKQRKYIIEKLKNINLLNCNNFIANYSLFHGSIKNIKKHNVSKKYIEKKSSEIEENYTDGKIYWSNNSKESNKLTLTLSPNNKPKEITIIIVKAICNSIEATEVKLKL